MDYNSSLVSVLVIWMPCSMLCAIFGSAETATAMISALGTIMVYVICNLEGRVKKSVIYSRQLNCKQIPSMTKYIRAAHFSLLRNNRLTRVREHIKNMTFEEVWINGGALTAVSSCVYAGYKAEPEIAGIGVVAGFLFGPALILGTSLGIPYAVGHGIRELKSVVYKRTSE